MRQSAITGFAAIVLLGGCVAKTGRPAAQVQFMAQPDSAVAANWRALIRPDDLVRINDVAGTWRIVLDEAARSHAKAIAAEGRLLLADAALARPLPTPGAYRCHTVRLGQGTATPPRWRGAKLRLHASNPLTASCQSKAMRSALPKSVAATDREVIYGLRVRHA